MSGVLARPLAERLADRLIPEPNSGCLLWLGRITRKGYGQMSIGRGGKATVHRVAFMLAYGPIPDGLTIDHKCRVRCCANPAHLEAVTSRTNTLRGVSFAAQRARQTHCIHGHPLSGSNLYLTKKGTRQCRACVSIRSRSRT